MKLRNWRVTREPRLMVIPMIDIIFFLLVFFMLNTLSMVQQNVLPVQLPKAKSADSQPMKQVAVTITEDGKVQVGEKVIAPHELRAQAQQELGGDPEVIFILRADHRISHGVVMEVLDELKIAGVKRISIATEGGS